jgi:lipopolysaccharide export system permease protein
MLFHSSFRKELARTFGATLVVLVTVVMTMTLIRTLSEATRGVFNPADVLMIMGYTVLSDLPTILTLCLFIAVVSVLTRMYRDSEMVIWLVSGRGLASLLRPLMRFCWPIFVVIFVLAFLVLPWAFGRIEDLRDQYQKRGDLARVEAGQFQESASGDRVFFIERDENDKLAGSHVFMVTRSGNQETITSAARGTVQTMGNDQFLVLENGQRLEKTHTDAAMTMSTFSRYGARIGADTHSARSFTPPNTLSAIALLQDPTPRNNGEMAWRCGLFFAAINLALVALAAAGANPRSARSTTLAFAFLIFVVYFNLLVLGKNWVETEKISLQGYLLVLHGGALTVGSLWLAIRHNQWALPRLWPATPAAR